jgi:hypothetical protein
VNEGRRMSNITSGQDVIRAVVNDIEVSMKQQGYVVAYTEEELQKMADLVQAEIEKAFELGRKDVMSKIILCKACKHWIWHDRRCGYWNHGVKPLDWCCYAERKTDGADVNT